MAKTSKNIKKTTKKPLIESREWTVEEVLSFITYPIYFVVSMFYKWMVKIPYNRNHALGAVRLIAYILIFYYMNEVAVETPLSNGLSPHHYGYGVEVHNFFSRNIGEGFADFIGIVGSLFLILELIVQTFVMLGFYTSMTGPGRVYSEFDQQYPNVSRTMESLDNELAQESRHGALRRLGELFSNQSGYSK